MSSAQTCPVYGDLSFPNFQGLPPIPLCCNPVSNYCTCETPTYTVQTIRKKSICQILPPAPYNEQFILTNLPLLTALLLTAIPRYFFCLLYDVGLAIYNVVSDFDKFFASLLDLLVAPLLGYAVGANYGGCLIVRDIINFFSGIPVIPPPTNVCPFKYTFNTTVQSILETIGFAFGSVLGLFNLLIGFIIDGIGIALCYLTNLTINFGVCFDVLGITFHLTGSVSPFSFLNVLNFMNCACVLGQLGLCPVINAIIGNCQPSSANCNVTNTGCPGVSQSANACQNCYNQCIEDVYTLAQAQQNYCDACYQSCKECCNGDENCIENCRQAWGQCNYCVNQLTACLQNQCQQYMADCIAHGGTPPSNCNPNVDYCNPSTCCFPETNCFSCQYSNYGCPTGSGCQKSSSS